MGLTASSLPPLRAWVELRPARPEDAPLFYAWRQEPSIRRYQPLGTASLEDLRAELRRQRPDELFRGRGELFQWVVLEDRKPVGWITLLVQSWVHGIAEIGFSLTTAAQGRGIMVQALELLLPTIFLGTTLERLEARCTLDNLRSQRVLDRLGFVREGRLRSYFVLDGRRVDNYLYALLRGDFLARRGLAPGAAREQESPPNPEAATS